MESYLTACSGFWAANLPLWLGVAAAGLVGSASHCSLMCAPVVAAQMLGIRQDKPSRWPMAYFHAGRIAAYIGLGVAAVVFSRVLFSGELAAYGHLLLMVAGAVFIISALLPRKTHRCCPQKIQALPRTAERLFPPAAAHYLRGALMGFMPCGMLAAMLLMVATLETPLQAAGAMLVFGVATTPVLQLAGYSALRLGRRYPDFFARAGRGVMVMNGLFLCGLGLNLVHVS